jgi:secretion/DNA translocation related CpaE-like protein
MHALLVTSDDRVISEFKKIAAVTQTHLVIASEPTKSEIDLAYRVFVSQEVSEIEIIHSEIILVVVSATNTQTWTSALRLSAKHVATIPDSRDWLIEHLTEPVKTKGLSVGLVPASGGAGASILACGLAFHARQIFQDVVLVDLDKSSASLDIAFGLENQTGMRWHDFSEFSGLIGGTDIYRSLPSRDGVGLLTHGKLSLAETSIPRNLIMDKLKEACDLVVIDLPKASDREFSLDVIADCDLVLVVTAATVRGCASAKRILADLAGYAKNIELAVRNVPGSNLDPIQIAELLNTPLASTLSTDSRIVEQIEQGFGVSGINLGYFTRNLNSLAQRISYLRELKSVA